MDLLAEPFDQPLTDATAMLDRRLSFARAILIRRRRANIAAGAIRSAAALAVPAAVVSGIMVFARLIGWNNHMPVMAAIALWAAAWTWIFIRAAWNAWRYQLSLVQTAQRVDQALASQNRLSSALEFREEGVLLGFRRLAIEDAILHLPSQEAIASAFPEQKLLTGLMSKLIVLAISLLAMILTSRLHPPAAVRIAAKGTRDVMSAYTAAPPAPSRKTASDENAVLAVRSANPNGVGPDQLPASAAKNPPLGYGSRPVAPQSIASAAGAGPTQTPAAGNDRKMGDAATPQAVPGESSRSQTEHSALPQFSDADMQPGSSGPSVAAGETASISGVGQSPEHAPEKGGNQTGADNNASHQGNENTKDAKSAQNAQSGQNQAGSRQAAGGQGGQNKDSTGGQGSGSGTSGAKKSRGAGTGLLGVHTADLFTGRDLPGPDQTRSIPTGPISQDLAPAAAALAPDRREDEPTLDVTHISPDDDALLDKYFSQLHQPPALPQHPSTREALPAAQ